MPTPVDAAAVHRRRLAAQLLTHQNARTPEHVTQHLLAVQAQDPRGARLALRARSVGLSWSAVDRALTMDRSLLVTWLNRGTLHLVHREDFWWLHALTNPQLATANNRRLAQEGVTPEAADRGVRTIARALHHGPLTRRQLRDHLDAAGIRTEGQALVHLLFRSAIAGETVRGPMVGGEHAFVLTADWLGAPPQVDRDRALARLAQRYLAGHGPATDRDLARWAGITVGAARRGFAASEGAVEDFGDGLLDLVGRQHVATLPPPRLLGAFEPVLLGWTSRAPIVGSHRHLVTDNGIFRPFAMVDGRAVATWATAGGRVTMLPLETIDPTDLTALAADADAVERFLGWTPGPGTHEVS